MDVRQQGSDLEFLGTFVTFVVW